MIGWSEAAPRLEEILEQIAPGRKSTAREGGGFDTILAVALDGALAAAKVGPALDALEQAGLLDPAALAEAGREEIVEALRLAGVALTPPALGVVQRLAKWLVERHHGHAEELAEVDTDRLRDELRALRGVGPTTAEAILLEALGRPAYPLDRPTYRVLVRHGWIDATTEFDEARELVELGAERDPRRLSLWSDGMNHVASQWCKAGVPRCERCPLRELLPEGGPRGAVE